jgi:NAD(P)-dependent dehydrogenase (short-subunit alcohol dehydrogenase family)
MQAHLRTAVVTGAGSGIGRTVALAMLQDGYRVALIGRRAEFLAQTATAAGPAAERALVVPGDVSDPAAVKAMFEWIGKTFGRLDVLFNNAGVSAFAASVEEVPYEEWRNVVDINLTGAFLCTQAAFKLMKSQTPCGGRIINNGSISAQVPRPNSAPYTATKHAITGLTKSTALDGRKYDIACGQIDIGNASTDMVSAMAKGVPQASGELAIEPLMDARHVAEAVLYMAGLPLDANVQSMTLLATKMPFVGRG